MGWAILASHREQPKQPLPPEQSVSPHVAMTAKCGQLRPQFATDVLITSMVYLQMPARSAVLAPIVVALHDRPACRRPLVGFKICTVVPSAPEPSQQPSDHSDSLYREKLRICHMAKGSGGSTGEIDVYRRLNSGGSIARNHLPEAMRASANLSGHSQLARPFLCFNLTRSVIQTFHVRIETVSRDPSGKSLYFTSANSSPSLP